MPDPWQWRQLSSGTNPSCKRQVRLQLDHWFKPTAFTEIKTVLGLGKDWNWIGENVSYKFEWGKWPGHRTAISSEDFSDEHHEHNIFCHPWSPLSPSDISSIKARHDIFPSQTEQQAHVTNLSRLSKKPGASFDRVFLHLIHGTLTKVQSIPSPSAGGKCHNEKLPGNVRHMAWKTRRQISIAGDWTPTPCSTDCSRNLIVAVQYQVLKKGCFLPLEGWASKWISLVLLVFYSLWELCKAQWLEALVYDGQGKAHEVPLFCEKLLATDNCWEGRVSPLQRFGPWKETCVWVDEPIPV